MYRMYDQNGGFERIMRPLNLNVVEEPPIELLLIVFENKK